MVANNAFIIKEMEENAEKRGEEKGKLEGKLEGKINTLIKLLTKKFKGLPDEYIQNLSKSNDEILDKIAEDIFDIENLNDLDKYF